MITVRPLATPPTTPVLLPTVAIEVALLLQVPLPVSLRVMVVPGHTDEGPDIARGSGFTIMVSVA